MKAPVTVTMGRAAHVAGPAVATVRGSQLDLPANGFAFLDAGGAAVDITVNA